MENETLQIREITLRIREAIKERGLTQEYVGKRIGKSKASLQSIMNGNPTIQTLDLVARGIGCSIKDLLPEDLVGNHQSESQPQQIPNDTDNHRQYFCPKCGVRFTVND